MARASGGCYHNHDAAHFISAVPGHADVLIDADVPLFTPPTPLPPYLQSALDVARANGGCYNKAAQFIASLQVCVGGTWHAL